MKPETIMQADLLDILFDNRNKDYGAYVLRRDYPRRVMKALGGMFLIVVLIFGSWYVSKQFVQTALLRPIYVDSVSLISNPTIDQPKPKEQLHHERAVTAAPSYQIGPDNTAGKMPENTDFDNKPIGAIATPGDSTGPVGPPPTGLGEGEEKKIIVPVKPPIPEDPEPFEHAELMPEFPGGMEALTKYLIRYLREPEGLEPGEKITVMVRFVVGADGLIEDAQVIKSGGKLDEQVLTVVRKMPRWKPGMQNHVNVPVYFTLPVTFTGPEE